MITKEKHRIRCFSFTEEKSFAIMAAPRERGGHLAARWSLRDHPKHQRWPSRVARP
jgi:hypothetical protein